MSKKNIIFLVFFVAVFLVSGFVALKNIPSQVPSSEESKDGAPSPRFVPAELSYDKMFYNQTTGELYPILPSGAQPHTCVWTIWGDHGSQMKLTTNDAFISSNTDPYIKSNGFLPPRVPIYVTCVDWQNRTYQGSIEYSQQRK